MRGYAAILLLLLSPTLTSGAAGITNVAESDPGLFIAMMMMLTGFICVALILMVLFAILAGIVLLLTGIDVISLSALSAWHHRSLSKGINTFFLLCMMAAGSIAMAALLFILCLFNVAWASAPTHITLLVCAGAAASWVSYRIIKKQCCYL